ncbi:hypothetical protein C6501_15460 [Candidatus Poribacteria bacterium]|nr:MAG: hypothetical protein C6501_15460 [Candidatus Poribacteria bacterium]
MKHFLTFLCVMVLLPFYFGCGDSSVDNPVAPEPAVDITAAPLGNDVVFENMYASEATRLADKTPVQIVTVLEGTGRVTLNARFRGVRDLGYGFPLYECELLDEAAEAMGGIAKGMSGSPVGPPGRIMGALAYGEAFSKSPMRFLVTSIDAMEDAKSHQTFGDRREAAPAAPSANINAVYTPVKTPVMITGVLPHQLEKLNSLMKGARLDFIELFADVGGAPAAPDNPTRLAAGDMIGVAMARGDVVNAIGFGTVTQVYDDGTFVAFGHPMKGVGKTSLPVYRAVVNGIVPLYEASYKSASAYGNPIGTITKDLTPAIVGELGVLPPMIPVKLTYQIQNDPVVEKNHEVAYGQELFIPVVAAQSMNAIRQEKSPGTIDVSLSLSFKETDRVYTESLRDASPNPTGYVFGRTDSILYNFTDLFANKAGKATLAAVDINIKERPHLYIAEVHDVEMETDTVIAGSQHTFTVVLLPHYSVITGERTLKKEVTLDIPEGFAGEALLSIASSDPFGLITVGPFDTDPDESEREPQPQTLDQLIEQLESVRPMDPGIITITLTPQEDSSGITPETSISDLFDELREDFTQGEREQDTVLLEPIVKQIVIDGFVVGGDYSKDIFIHDLFEGTEPEAPQDAGNQN